MYGYFRPFRAGLTRAEAELFRAHYCRVCYCLRLLGGQSARYLTTYDIAVYSLLLQLGREGEPPLLMCQRLGKKNMRLFSGDETGLKLARLSMISFGEKFRDDELDGESFKEKAARAFFRKRILRAAKEEPELAEIARSGTDEINRLQDANAPIFAVLKAYGDMAVRSFSCFRELSAAEEELFRSLSEWIFFLDMVCDYGDDFASGAYNGLKTEGCPTFSAYFDRNYIGFLQLQKAVTDRLVSALFAVKEKTRRWNVLYKVILFAADTVIPSVIEGEDVKYHYFKELRRAHRALKDLRKSSKRLKELPNE